MSRPYLVRIVQAGSNAVTESTLLASDEASLRQLLLSQGHVPLEIRPGRRTSKSVLANGRLFKRAKPPAYALFCRELRTLVDAGMTVVEAVDTLSARERLLGQQQHSLAAKLLEHLQEGKSLSNALALLPDVPSVLVAAVRAGERTSDLPQALEDYLRFDTMIGQLKRKVVSAAIYPALVTGLGVSISVFLLLVVMPNFARMYEQVRTGSAGLSGLMISMSLWVNKHQVVTLAGVAVLMVVLVIWVWSGMARAQLMLWIQKPSWVRRKAEDFQLAMMYQALALMLKGGYPMTEAMAVASRSALDARMSEALGQALSRIEQGAPVAQSLMDAHLCDEVGRRLMAAAERNGDFHRAADVVSRLHAERFELFIERVTRVVEPVLLMAVALMVGTIVVMMYLPVFDMATRLR